MDKKMSRQAKVTRKTKETDIKISLNIDGQGNSDISTGIGFFNHMLELFARHGLFDLKINCQGDLQIDDHHTVEDVAITLGRAFAQALGDKAGIERYGAAYVPMDETLVRTVVDLSGRAFLVYNVPPIRPMIGTFAVELAEHFWHSFADAVRANIHIELLYGRNQHHILEAVFKSAARALSEATKPNPRIQGIMSTKGTLS
jgi:imidazoleglycerol-phosphate dehydratase